MSVDNNELFELLRLASFENEFKISSSAFTESRNNVYGFVVSENKKIHFCHYPKHRKEEKLKQCPKSKLETKKVERVAHLPNIPSLTTSHVISYLTKLFQG